MPNRINFHPLIRVVSFLILSGFLAFGGIDELLIATAVIAVSYVLAGTSLALNAWPMLKRMRWLFLSLLIVYFWFTPGQPLLFSHGPTQQGIETGLLRISVLIMLVMAVNLLLQTTARGQLIVAILWLATPLRWLGIEADRLAVRIVLTLETVIEAQLILKQRMPTEKDANPVSRISKIASTLFHGVIARAEQAPCQAIEIPDYGHPPAYQWIFPLALAGVFWLVA